MPAGQDRGGRPVHHARQAPGHRRNGIDGFYGPTETVVIAETRRTWGRGDLLAQVDDVLAPPILLTLPALADAAVACSGRHWKA